MQKNTSWPKVLVIAGYFDWFSGYQETILARALASRAEVHVLAGDRVSPIFSDTHLGRIHASRRYATGTRDEHGVTVTRLPTREIRSMVWARGVPHFVSKGNFDAIIQIMPGQGMPALASFCKHQNRAVLYGDNSAMYAALRPAIASTKFAVFAVTKGLLYSIVNLRARRIFGYTPNTLHRLRRFNLGKRMDLFPLGFDETIFSFRSDIRTRMRSELSYDTRDTVIIAAGKVQAQKRLDLLLTAVEDLSPAWPRIRLLLVGLDDGAPSVELRNRIAASPALHERTTIRSFVDSRELNRLFNASDIGVWPRMPAITIQQAMGTGLDVLIPEGDFTSHLMTASGTARPVRPQGELADELVPLLYDQPRTEARRASAAAANGWLAASNLIERLLPPEEAQT